MRVWLAGLLVLSLLAPAVEAKRPVKKKSGAASHKSSASHKPGRAGKSRRKAVVRRQTQPEPERIREIQEALRREGYLAGAATGRWDDDTRGAMARYQKDHGFTATGRPDSLSLIKLGLGPRHENLLQPSSPPAPNP